MQKALLPTLNDIKWSAWDATIGNKNAIRNPNISSKIPTKDACKLGLVTASLGARQVESVAFTADTLRSHRSWYYNQVQ